MNAALPAYYHRLARFRAAFEQSTPILTYHKLGPRPRRVRLKGMYLSSRLFQEQLEELRAAGFSGAPISNWNATPAKRVVITFDDGYVNVLRHGLDALAHTGFKAIQFLPANLLGKRNEWDISLGEAPEAIMDPSQVREWLSAGHEIGSHSLLHPFLTRISPDLAREEIVASRKKLEDLFDVAIQHFCYPYGDWNEQVRGLVIQAGYKTACTTDSGINLPEDSAFSLKRFTARYSSRNLKAIWSWFGARSTVLRQREG